MTWHRIPAQYCESASACVEIRRSPYNGFIDLHITGSHDVMRMTTPEYEAMRRAFAAGWNPISEEA